MPAKMLAPICTKTFSKRFTRTTNKARIAWLGAGALVLALAPGAALAGRGSSPGAIKAAIASGSVDAISAELERSEQLVCGGCVNDVKPLVDNPDPRIRKVAAWWLSRRGLRSDLFVEMATRLGQPDSRKAEAAADVLGSLRTTKAIEPLGAALNNPRFDGSARAAMAAALGRIGDAAATPALAQAAGDPDAQVRSASVAALRDLRGGIPAGTLITHLQDADESVRVQAIYSLGATRGAGLDPATRSAATSALAALVTDDARPRVRRKAAWALGEIHGVAALATPALSTALADPDPAVRSLAGAALAKLGQ
jgi:HEAT repeat protein